MTPRFKRALTQIAWFIGLWALSVASLAAFARLLRYFVGAALRLP